MRAILFQPNDSVMTDIESMSARGISSRNFDADHCDAVDCLLMAGKYVARGLTRSVSDYDNESIFDSLNMGEMPKLADHMSVGDVLIWESGVRYLCLHTGWRAF